MKVDRQIIKRKKLYKAGKVWVAALVFGASVFGLSELKVASADSTNVPTLSSNGQYGSNDGGSTWHYTVDNQPVKGLFKDSAGQYRYFRLADGLQIKGQILSIDGEFYSFDAGSGQGKLIPSFTGGSFGTNGDSNTWQYHQANGQLVKGLASVDGQILYFDTESGNQVKGSSVDIDGKNYYFDAGNGRLIGTIDHVQGADTTTDHAQGTDSTTNHNQGNADNTTTLRGLINNNGKLNYYDPSTGEQAKGKQVVTNGATYYFNNNGEGQYLFSNTETTPSTEVSQKNAVNSINSSDYTNTVDGFLTADTTYRPKYILDNGTNWRPSNEGEYRPFIMNWWPSKNVQVNYLKLMQENGLLSNAIQYSIFSDQTALNAAAFQAQIEIEKRIKAEGSTAWLNNLLYGADGKSGFVRQQSIWNADSESPWQGDAWFQGGYLKYGNSVVTPTTNSNYRQPGNAFDFLLANDVDNQNPAVQAEDLNWLYYLTNFGSITTNGAVNNANFDSVRIDAVDFIHNDALQRSYDYLRQAFNLTSNERTANNHLSLVEAGVDAGTTVYNQEALIESNFRELARTSLVNASGKNESLANLIKDIDSNQVIADHSNYSKDEGIPNYAIIHAHDKGIQENVGKAISDLTGADWTNFTNEQLKTGLKAYYEDQRSSNKQYNSYNLPAAYALMLTNKGTVPRIYYGDMYQDDGQYMANKSIYYDAISSLMNARKSYVAGGQTMSVDDQSGILKSVRFGKGAMTAADEGNSETRTQGIGVLVGNDASTTLNDNQKITLSMGKAHRNQAYRALMLTTPDGLALYNSDENAPIVWTDDNGDLTFTNQDINHQENTKIKGTLNPQVSGYLAAWVPVGASENQDARTTSSTTATTDNKVLHSNAALDSQLIFEGFSNFQPMPTTHDEMANVVIARNAKTFHDWGVTSFEMAPQYRSSADHTFVDSTIDNGYAFSDRYDLGFGTPTKYGTDEDLRNAIAALHDDGMQVMADVVMNQLYSLPGKEVVSASRAGVTGNNADLPFGEQLYVVNTKGGGEYQKKYGGAFLGTLKEKYPDLFNSKQYEYYLKNYADNGRGPAYLTNAMATRATIPSDDVIKEWSAKYMNGTNILGRGMGYVLKDWNNGQYFKLSGDTTSLADRLIYRAGWSENQNGTWSYYDLNNGHKVTGLQTIDGQLRYFDENGIQIKGDWVTDANGHKFYYDANQGLRLTGFQVINGEEFEFSADGILIRNIGPIGSAAAKQAADEAAAKQAAAEAAAKQAADEAAKKAAEAEAAKKNADAAAAKQAADEAAKKNADAAAAKQAADEAAKQNADAEAAKQAADEAAKKNANEAAAKQAADEAAKKNADAAAAKQAADEAAKKNADEAAAKQAADEAAKKTAEAAAAKQAADEAAKQAADAAAARQSADAVAQMAAKKAADENAAKQAAEAAAKSRVQPITGAGTNAESNNQTAPVTNGQENKENHDGWTGYLFDADANGWRWFENGEHFTGFRHYAGTYYWFQDGIRQDNAFHQAWGLTYYTDADGRAVQGIQNIHGQELDFGNDGTYYLRSTGYLWDGSAANGGYRWYEAGQLYTGFRYYYGTYYWFVNGVRQNAGWREAWGMKYYTDDNGRAVQGLQNIDGKLYYFGDNGTYNLRTNQTVKVNEQEYRANDDGSLTPWSGYIYDGSSENGGYRWYEDGQLYTGFRYYYGTYYWFVNGVRQNAGWRQAWGLTYWTDADGRAVQGWQSIDGQNYYFGDNGTYYLR
ncbi:glycoside hydrolase family 70 protein [Leuconostocaceae bacterium ESL0958]|nr:glycoside hydrolase family 70 protein [Leuconostocaceae bacterium ESL0958]